MSFLTFRSGSYKVYTLLLMGLFLVGIANAEVLQPKELLSLKTASSVVISPDGKFAAYTVSVPRAADDRRK